MKGELTPEEAASNVVVEDDRHESGFFEEEFEEGDFTEDDDEKLMGWERGNGILCAERTMRMHLSKYFGCVYRILLEC